MWVQQSPAIIILEGLQKDSRDMHTLHRIQATVSTRLPLRECWLIIQKFVQGEFPFTKAVEIDEP